MKFKSFINNTLKKKSLCCVLSGVLSGAAINFTQLFWLAFISMVPFLAVIFKDISARTRMRCFFIYGIAFYLFSYNWFLALHPLDWLGIEGNASLFSAVAIWLIVSLLHTLGFTATGLIYSLIRPVKSYRIVLFCALYILWEYAQQFSQYAFPWAKLALTQHAFLPMIQSASLFGAFFTSLIILLINSFLTFALLNEQAGFSPVYVILACAVLFINCGYGSIRLLVKEESQSTVKVAAIQGNVNPVEKWSSSSGASIDRYKELTAKAVSEGAKIVFWPETAIPIEIEDENYYDNALSDIAKESYVVIVAGSFGLNSEGLPVNIMRMYLPDGSKAGESYEKRSIVPLGEYLPKGFLIDILSRYVPSLSAAGDIYRGDKAVVFDSGFLKVSPLICYDSVFPSYTAQSVKGGAQIMFVGTNDAYYRTSKNPYQHFGHAVLRAAESGKYFVRSANTGVSGIIDAKGRTISRLELDEEGYLVENVHLSDKVTLYNKTGDLVVFLCYAAVLMVLFLRLGSCFIKKYNFK